MKVYYIGGIGLGLILFVILFTITGISSCVQSNRQIDDVKDAAKNTVVIRYYADDDTDSSPVYYARINKKDSSARLMVPQKDGYIFAGYYDQSGQTLYADANGNLLILPDESVVLYPVFAEG